ncbi:MAG TPA: FAD:protein FMN transferase [Lunatimonas sp.]|nr:FAD:protein FMN transferase [Lunatimonas sp.]
MQKNALKNIIYSIVLLLLVFLVYLYRKNQPITSDKPDSDVFKMVVSGQTMGTSYRIVYLDPSRRNFKHQIDSLLDVFNQSLSTYIPDSEISRFNKGDSLVYESKFFFPILEKSKEVYTNTDGAFDPTVGPLVNVWGFGPGGASLEDSVSIPDLLRQVGLEKVEFDSVQVRKSSPGIYLDFSAIAKGYGVDVVGEFLESKEIEHFLVEIGGELLAKGSNENGELWRVGVTKPDEEGAANELFGIIALNAKGLATSGNYRNFYIVDGKKFSHTISPFTGYPVVHGLLGATVVADDCMTADAYATAMMVMGTEKSIALQKEIEGLEIFLIYNDENGVLKSYVSEGLKPYLSYSEQNKPSLDQ